MRQVGDTLVWLGLIAVVVAVVYFTPRLSIYFSSRDRDSVDAERSGMAWRYAPITNAASEPSVR